MKNNWNYLCSHIFPPHPISSNPPPSPRGGVVAVQACPGGAAGWARRLCQSTDWAGPADLSECRSVWLATLESRAKAHDSLMAVASDLAKVRINE